MLTGSENPTETLNIPRDPSSKVSKVINISIMAAMTAVFKTSMHREGRNGAGVLRQGIQYFLLRSGGCLASVVSFLDRGADHCQSSIISRLRSRGG